MTNREKLVKLLSGVQAGGVALDHEALKANAVQNEEVADYLIANGVTVKEMQKPILETELMVYYNSPVWFEEFGRDVEEIPLLLDGLGIYYAEFKEYGRTERLDRRLDDYNFQWRCWAEKPTDEERKAAEWEK